MSRRFTFGQKIGLGFAVLVALSLAIAAVSIGSMQSVAAAKDRALSGNAEALLAVERLRTLAERRLATVRAYLLTQDEADLSQLQAISTAFDEALRQLQRGAHDAEETSLLKRLAEADAQYRQAIDRLLAQKRAGATAEQLVPAWNAQVKPPGEEMRSLLDATVRIERADLEHSLAEADRILSWATRGLVTSAGVVVLLSALLGWLLSRGLARQVGSAVQHLQSSSTQLQASAQQQATTAKEQATATTEVTTTVRELLVSSKQIGESAQRVARIAEQTASAAHTGDETLRKAHQQMLAIKRQVDRIVDHMLDLGKKSQQVGGILEIINELAEQTNILAINATIESAGAGEAGRRFAVVAEEIRRLADRVGDSTKEIRSLLDEIRSAANTTAMATEEGSKAAEAGARKFDEVTARFSEISSLLVTATEAAREIELSTRQQTTAVEQVNQAILNVSDSAREVETGSRETVQVATRLAELSRALTRLIRPRAAAGAA